MEIQPGNFTKNTLKIGDPITVEAYRAKDGTNLGHAVSVTLADGRKMQLCSEWIESVDKPDFRSPSYPPGRRLQYADF